MLFMHLKIHHNTQLIWSSYCKTLYFTLMNVDTSTKWRNPK